MSSKNMDLSSLIDKYKGDPAQFIEEVGGIKLTNFQKDYIRFFYKNKEKRVYMMRSTRHADMNSWLYSMFLIMEKYELKKRWVFARPSIFLKEYEIKMARKVVCDICGKECESNGKYELIYKSWLKTKKEDICFGCICKIKDVVRLQTKVELLKEEIELSKEYNSLQKELYSKENQR